MGLSEPGLTPPAADQRPHRFGSLVRALADSLVLETVAEPDPGPFVYTAAIHTTADLVSSLAGITCLARELGFTRHPQTCYAEAGHCASWHAQHVEWPLSLTVDCHPLRQTVAIAVSGLDAELTYNGFVQVEASLFGAC
jgi:hypothetical protein